MEQKFFNHSATLGEITQFSFIMLGSFWNDCGLATDLQRKYEEKDSTVFSKYNLFDPEQELAKDFEKFKEKIDSYQANSMETISLLEFPKCLLDGITKLTLSYSEPRKINFSRVAKLYLNYHIIYFNKKFWNHNSFQEIQAMIQETYSSIIKEKPDLNFKELQESATWKTISDYLTDLKESGMIASETKKNISARIVRHYLFIHFLKALEEVFEVDVQELQEYYTSTSLNKIIEEIEWLKTVQKIEGVHQDTSIWYWLPSKAGTEVKTQKFNEFLSQFTGNAPLTEYFLNSNDVIKRERASQLLRHLRSNWAENPQAAFFENWFRARTEIFCLKFDGSDSDKTKVEEAQKLYKETFENFKYIAGKNLQEFIFDALAIETYFNQKQKKDILNNSQDDSNKSSLTKQAKTYWEFAYAVGLLDNNSMKTYLSAYNVAKNFWWAFPMQKFNHQENVQKRFKDEIQNEELRLPSIISDFSDKKKIDNLLSKERGDLRQKLGNRYYSNLTIAIMKAQTAGDFDRINAFITAMDAEKLAVNDECGATPLIRALQEYKCCQLNHSSEYRKKRGELLFQWNNEQEELNSHLCGNMTVGRRIEEERKELGKRYFNDFIETTNYLIQSIQEETREEMKKRKNFLKEKVIIPLIEKIPASSLLDEALELDYSSCVSALQLAIDSYDAELVECILKKLPENPLTFYISDEYTTPLQYAIRKYDFWNLTVEKHCGKKENIRSLSKVPKRKITSGGIFNKEQDIASKSNQIPILQQISSEIFGFVRDFKSQQEHLVKIIHLLADKTNPISVDNFYYLIDQMDPEDNIPYNQAIELAQYLLETGHVDLTMTDNEWTRNKPSLPFMTVLGYCIDKYNYSILQLLLESQYTEQLKEIINLRLAFKGNEEKFRYQTDPLMFVQNMILNIKNYYLKDPEKYDAYGKEIAKNLYLFLTLFSKVGANFDLPDQEGKSIKDYLREWKDKFPDGAIPEFLNL